MADIVLIYGKENKDTAKKLVAHLEARWSVWWDKHIKVRFAEEIQEEVRTARCAVVLWSEDSREKDTVRDDAQIAKDHEVPIVGVSLDGSKPAYGFGGYSSTPLSGWNGKTDHPEYEALFSRLESLLPAPQPPKKPSAIGDDHLRLPTIFLSVSSFETQLTPDQAVKALTIARVPAILVSAWDLVERPDSDPLTRNPAALIEELKRYRQTGGFVLLDSGNYESSRLSMHDWEPNDLEQALGLGLHDWSFCFDKLAHFNFDKSQEPEDIADIIVGMVQSAQSLTESPILPVVHAPPSKNSGYQFELIPKITKLLAEALRPKLIGIPERELGAGILQRVKTMLEIRKELNTLSFYQPIHLLGTGNPWTVVAMAAAGADTFDGLEWCRTVVDHDTHRLNHFQHFDLFTLQAELSGSELVTQALRQDSKVDFSGRVAFHNLHYFDKFGDRLRDAATRGKLEVLVAKILGNVAAEILDVEIPGLFDHEV